MVRLPSYLLFYYVSVDLAISTILPQNTPREGSDPHLSDPWLRLSHSMRLKRERQPVVLRDPL